MQKIRAKLCWMKFERLNDGVTMSFNAPFCTGRTDMRKRLPGASLSKWPAALTIAGLVADGRLTGDQIETTDMWRSSHNKMMDGY